MVPVTRACRRRARCARRDSGAKTQVDGLEDLRGGAEGDAEIHFAEFLARTFDLGLHFRQHALEDVGVGTLEGVDRLLAVSHHEERAGLAAVAAFACEEFIRQCTDDLPLHRARVLRLVHQQVLDAAVELVEHPGGIRPLAQQFARPDDEVVEVIGAAAALGLLELRDDGAAEAQHGLRGGKAFEIAHAAQRVEQAGLVRPYEVVDPAMPLQCVDLLATHLAGLVLPWSEGRGADRGA